MSVVTKCTSKQKLRNLFPQQNVAGVMILKQRLMRIHKVAQWHCPPALFWLSSNVVSQQLTVAPQYSDKISFYSSVYSITLIQFV
jgi:hypothetical protein